jgi:hypothetical protein
MRSAIDKTFYRFLKRLACIECIALRNKGITLGSVSVIMRPHVVMWPPRNALLMPKKTALFPEDENYNVFLKDLKSRIRRAQVKAALAVNNELIILYWQIGREIISRQQREGWGSKVIDRLAKDLKREFPDMTGLSSRNLKYMRSLADAYPDKEIVLRVVALFP